MKKQLTLLAILVTFLAKASGTNVTYQNSVSFPETVSDTIEDTGITVLSEYDSDSITEFETIVSPSNSKHTSINFNLWPFSYSYSTEESVGFKDAFKSFFREFKNLDFPFFMSGGLPPMLGTMLGLSVVPIFLILFIIAGAVALYMIGKNSREKEKEKEKRNADKAFDSKQEYHNNKEGNSFTRVDQYNEKKNKALVLIICGGILLFLSVVIRDSGLLFMMGAIALMIIGIVNYFSSISSRK